MDPMDIDTNENAMDVDTNQNATIPQHQAQVAPWSPTFVGLPDEMLLQICSYLEGGDARSRKDLFALTRTCKRIQPIATELLYKHNSEHQSSSCIIWAIRKMSANTLTTAIDFKLDVNARVPLVRAGEPNPTQPRPMVTPLSMAAKLGSDAVADLLLIKGANINRPSQRLCDCERGPNLGTAVWVATVNHQQFPLWRPLHTAMCNKKMKLVELLIGRGASLRLEATTDGYPAIHMASQLGLPEVINLLSVQPDFDVQETDLAGNTALHFVSLLKGARGSPVIRATIAILIDHGADLEAANDARHTPLIAACREGNFVVASELLAQGANPCPDSEVEPELHPLFLCTYPRSHFRRVGSSGRQNRKFLKSRRDLVATLIEEGIPIDARFDIDHHERRMTALMLACQQADTRLAGQLVELGASVHAQDHRGKTPLYYACNWGFSNSIAGVDDTQPQFRMATKLINLGARLDSVEPGGSYFDWILEIQTDIFTAVFKAATAANISPENTKALLDKAITEAVLDDLEPVARFRAIFEFTARTYGLDSTYHRDLIAFVIANGSAYLMNCFLDLSLGYYSAEVLFAKAMSHGRNWLSKTIMTRRIDVTAEPRFWGGQGFLHLAVQLGDIKLVEDLLERAADVDVFDDQLRTPLSVAVAKNRSDIAKALMHEVADAHLRPTDELLQRLDPESTAMDREFTIRRFQTAFDVAVRESRVEIVQDMIDKYELPEIGRHTTGLSYVHQACLLPTTTILQLLLAKGAPANGGEGCMETPADMLREKIRENAEDKESVEMWRDALRVLLLLC